MKTIKIIFVFCYCVFVASPTYSNAQNISKTKKQINDFVNHANNYSSRAGFNNIYDTIATSLDLLYDEEWLLKNGKVFSGYFPVKGSPFLFGGIISQGVVTLNSISFKPVNLLYDIYSDNLVCLMLNKTEGNNSLILNKLAVNDFLLQKKKFIHIENKNKLSGYYEVIYKSDELMLLAKWEISIKKGSGIEQMDYFSDPVRTLFLVKKNKVEKIKNKKDIASFFDVKKNKIKQKIHRLSKVSNEDLYKVCKTFDY